MAVRERIEWCDIWVEQANEGSPERILMVGDSITRSYYPVVAELTGPEYAYARLTTSKSICDEGFTRELAFVMEEYTFRLIHLNNGLHGWLNSVEDYTRKTAEVMDLLIESVTPSGLIWATTTPLRQKGDLTRMDPGNDRVRHWNRIVTDLAGERNIRINDLYTVGADHPEYYLEDGIHYNEAGAQALGKQVHQSILSSL